MKFRMRPGGVLLYLQELFKGGVLGVTAHHVVVLCEIMDQSRDRRHVVALGQATIATDDWTQAPHSVVRTREWLEAWKFSMECGRA